jgi:bifunctional DNA-binding transcriptional regulator/antitoxin component of YhaV-PrlF toxin-antitoxin module
MNTWNIPIESEYIDGVESLYITLPEEILSLLDLSEGDEVEFIDNQDGSFKIQKFLNVQTETK